jgi:pimeloyl-ACP methyl ester carboxylesterase
MSSVEEFNIPSVQFAVGTAPDGKEHKVAYRVWGEEIENPAACVFCIHGLTGNSTNFTFFADYITRTRKWRVVALDMIGRGESSWLDDKSRYTYDQYASDFKAVLARTRPALPDTARLLYVGSSMGGLIGFHLFAEPSCPLSAFVINDVGPAIPGGPLDLIRRNNVSTTFYASPEEAFERVKNVYAASMGPTTDDRFFHFLTDQALVRAPGGEGWIFNYDGPGLVRGLSDENGEVRRDFWALWGQITAPMLLLWGVDSVILSKETVEEMQRRTPALAVVPVAGTGHMPPLYVDAENEIVAAWLDSHVPASVSAAAAE